MKNDFEVIFVNDGSEDLTEEEIRAQNFSLPIKYLEFKNSGAAFARNQGAKEAQGEFLIFFDSDLMVRPDFIERHIRFYESLPKEKKGVLIGSIIRLREDFNGNINDAPQYAVRGDHRTKLLEILLLSPKVNTFNPEKRTGFFCLVVASATQLIATRFSQV